MRGVEKKSRPPATIAASLEPSVGSATSSFTTPPSPCRSRTQINSEPSGVTRPSAYRCAPVSGVIGMGAPPGS